MGKELSVINSKRTSLKVNSGKNPNIDFDWVIRNESQRYFLNVNSAGSAQSVGSGVSTLAWRTATKGAATLNTYYNIFPGAILPAAGRTIYVEKISVELTDAVQVAIRHQKNGSTYGLAGNQTPLLVGVFQDEVKNQNNPTGGLVEWDFVREEGQPRKVRYGEQIGIFAATNSLTTDATKQSNYSLNITGYSLTNDENYSAPFTQGNGGDSIQVPVSDVGELEYAIRSSAIHGLWPLIVNKHLRDNGIECRWSDIALGGSNSTQWEIDVARGLFRYWKPDILSFGLGMNDCESTGYFRTTTGVDGIFTNAYKNIINSYFSEVPSGCFVVNQVTDSDLASKLVTFSSGIYTGLTRLQAIRLEVIAVVFELKALYPSYDLVLADMSPSQTFTASEKDNYVTAEQGSGASIHPNARLGQPKMAIKAIQAIDTTTFFQTNKTT